MSNKAKIAKYRTIIDTLAKENESLRLKLLYAKTYEGTRQFIVDLIKELEEKRQLIEEKDNCILGLKEDIEKRNQHNIENLFETFDNENYFKGLSLKEVFELAKKSIRLTKENSELEDRLEYLEKTIEGQKQLEYFKKYVFKIS